MMNREILKSISKPEDKLLIARLLDQYSFCETRNRTEHTDFFDLYQQSLIEKILKKLKISNYVFFGGFEEAERKVLVFYPEKFQGDIVEKQKEEILKIISIELPNDLISKYTHKIYLGGLMKLGIKREKIGDILVLKDGADIIVTEDIANFLEFHITELTRFQKSKIEIKSINEARKIEQKTEILSIIVPSMRLDSIVSEIISLSRTKAVEVIKEERVFVNFEKETRLAREIKENDYITIRGKGRVKIGNIKGKTKKGNLIMEIEKYQ